METQRLRMTEKQLASLKVGQNIHICDTETRGLQLWIGAKSMTWYVRKMHDGIAITSRLGEYPAIRLAEARTKAILMMSSLANHNAPDVGKGIVPTVGEAIDGYLAKLSNKGTFKNASTCFRKCIHLRGIGIDELDREHTKNLHESLSKTPVHANRVFAFLKAAVRQSSRLSGIQLRPAVWDVELNHETPRDRYLERDEAPRFIKAIETLMHSKKNMTTAYAIMMMLLTGTRKSNVLQMQWSEIEGNVWTIPKGKYKTGRAMRIYLGEREMGILDRMREMRSGEYVFGINGKHMTDIRWTFRKALSLAGIERNTTPHDLRRTLGTWMLTSGSPIAVVSKKLGHSSISVTERVYAHIMEDRSIEDTERAIDSMTGV